MTPPNCPAGHQMLPLPVGRKRWWCPDCEDGSGKTPRARPGSRALWEGPGGEHGRWVPPSPASARRLAVVLAVAVLAGASPAAAEAPTVEATLADHEVRLAQCEDHAQEALARAVQAGFLARFAIEAQSTRPRPGRRR